MHYGQVSGRPFSRSAGLSGARFRQKIKIFRKETLPRPGWPGIIPTIIWCEMSAIRGDCAALCGDLQRNSIRMRAAFGGPSAQSLIALSIHCRCYHLRSIVFFGGIFQCVNVLTNLQDLVQYIYVTRVQSDFGFRSDRTL